MLAAMLLPVLQTTRQKAKYARWLGYKNNLRCDPSLVAYYTFEEAKDATGNPNATLENMATVGDFSKSTIDFSGYSDPEEMDGDIHFSGLGGWSEKGRWTGKDTLEFNGTSNYVDCGNDPRLNITKAITVEVWVKPYSATGSSKGIASQDNKYMLRVFNNTFEGYIKDSSGFGWHGTQTSAITLRKWYHAVMTYDGSDIRLYVNGDPDGIHPYVGTINFDNTTLSNTIGCKKDKDTGSLEWFFDGTIGEVAIYNRALSALEIKGHYKMGRP